MPNPAPVTLHASGAETTSSSSPALDIGTLRQALRLRLDVSEVSGLTPPGLQVFVETGPTSSGPWKNHGGFAPVSTGSTFQRLSFAPCERFVRARWALPVAGTPSATFELSGEALVIYALPEDIWTFGIRREAIEALGVTVSDMVNHLIAASDQADGAINNAFTLPLSAWSNDLRSHVARFATLTVLNQRGWQPEGPDDVVKMGHSQAIQWFALVARGQLTPPGIVDSTPEVYDAGAYVVSDPPRGW